MEIWDAYLSDGTPAGCDLIRGEPIPAGLYHLVCEILVRHVDGSYLLMQRDLRKKGYPGRWEATAGGSALKGEDVLACARRELLEETGLVGTLTAIGRYVAKDTIYRQYLCVTAYDKATVTLQEGETIDFCWLDEDAFVALAKSGRIVDRQLRRFRSYFEKRRIPV